MMDLCGKEIDIEKVDRLIIVNTDRWDRLDCLDALKHTRPLVSSENHR